MASMPYRAKDGATRTRTRSQRVARCALLAALGLALAAMESAFPQPVPVPGIRLGLANIVTVIAALWLGPTSATAVFLVRVVLAAMLTGQLATLPFSLIGGGIALVIILAFARFAPPGSTRLSCMVAAVAHNIAQVGVAIVLTATPQLVLYLPVLLVVGLITGFLTGSITEKLRGHLVGTPASALRPYAKAMKVTKNAAADTHMSGFTSRA